MRFSNVLLLASLSLGCAIASAQPAQVVHGSEGGQQGEQGQGPGNQVHRRPPAEALAACNSLATGAACSFTSPHGAQTGTCGAPEGKPLACRPQRGPGGDHPPMKDKPKN